MTTTVDDTNASPLVLGAMFLCLVIALVIFIYAESYSFERICAAVGGQTTSTARGKLCVRADGTRIEVK